MFSVNVADGARSVPDAVLMIADSSAPKNITCAKTGVCLSTSVGRICCGSFSIRFLNIPGSISDAEYARNIGMNAKTKYRLPPSTDPATAVFSFFADITRWKTSCCGIEPNIIVIHAATKARISFAVSAGQNSNLPDSAAELITFEGPPARSLTTHVM